MKVLLMAATMLVLSGVQNASAQEAPVIAKGRVFYVGLQSPTTLSAFDASSGALIWSSSLGALCTNGRLHPAAQKDVVYVGCETSSGGGIAALDAATGRLNWYTILAAVSSSPSPQKDTVYIGTQSGVVAVDGMTGAIRWLTLLGAVNSSPAVEKDVVFVSTNVSGTDYLTALDAISGLILYQSIAPADAESALTVQGSLSPAPGAD